MTTTPPKVSPVAVHVRPGQVGPWSDNPLWRRGPDTPDGFWMIFALGGVIAVHVILDDRAPDRTWREMWDELCDATDPGRKAREVAQEAAQDSYLAALTIAAEIPPEELVRLRDAVRAGQVGGRADGRRPRKAKGAA